MRVLTRGDMDGLTSIVLLSLVENITEITFTHPKDMQDGKVPVTQNDIVINLPYVKGCGIWFDHHISEAKRASDLGAFKGKFAVAPSTARVIYDYYKHPEFERFKDLLEATDRLDSGRLTLEDVTNPSGWILLGLTLDPRSGLAMGFRDYFRWLATHIREMPLEKLLASPEVSQRSQRVRQEQEELKKVLLAHSHQEGNVIITDLRGVTTVPAGNRFLIYTLYPDANVEVRLFPGILNNTVVAVGHSIFNRTCKTNVGQLLAEYGGGGHPGAGTCQIPDEEADVKIAEIVARLREK
ncbi:MAG: exopolyphosphatase [Chloroflexi bacterium]|nr:exopolyphosphatase [Chloroflexota bacterium]